MIIRRASRTRNSHARLNVGLPPSSSATVHPGALAARPSFAYRSGDAGRRWRNGLPGRSDSQGLRARPARRDEETLTMDEAAVERAIDEFWMARERGVYFPSFARQFAITRGDRVRAEFEQVGAVEATFV